MLQVAVIHLLALLGVVLPIGRRRWGLAPAGLWFWSVVGDRIGVMWRQGQILLAGPRLEDPNFAQTVTLLVQHDDEGALGLVLNRPTKLTVAAALEQHAAVASSCGHIGLLHHGGPCSGPLMLLHNRGDRSGVSVCDGVHFTVDADDVAWLLEHHDGPMKCFAGYAGWGSGQLEAEIEVGSWLIARATREAVFDGGEGQWLELLSRIDPTHAKLARQPWLRPADPTVN
jgi:putative transcriptional regulator